jgi:hypothetical protein
VLLFEAFSLDTSLLQSIEIPDMTGENLPDQMATVGAGVTGKHSTKPCATRECTRSIREPMRL